MNPVERVERVPLKSGIPGTDQTIDVMSKAAMGRWGAGSPIVRNKAISIIRNAGVPERDKMGEVAAIHEFVKSHLRYVKDPLWYEFVTHPETLLTDRADGDCDDHVTLEAALLGAVGIPSRFVVYGFGGAPQFGHVAMHARVGNAWVPLDPIVKDQPAGWEVPDATSRKVYGMNTPDGPQNPKVGVFDVVGTVLGLWALWQLFSRTLRKLQ